MSKETSALYPIAITALFLKKEFRNKKIFLLLVIYFFIAFIFLLIYRIGTSHVTTIDTYSLQITNIKLIINNSLWYFLWAIGAPNFVPNYIQSILFKPLPDFWNLFTSDQIRWYFYFLIVYYFLFLGTVIAVFIKEKKHRKEAVIFVLSMIFLFFLFIGPTIPIIHRWMVRLTVPLAFVLLIQTYFIYKSFSYGKFLKVISVVLISIYIILNYLGIQIHESSGLFIMDSQTVKNARVYFKNRSKRLEKSKIVYFVDYGKSAWGGSKELKNMFHDNDFSQVLFRTNIKFIFNADTSSIPKHAYVIESNDILTR